ncbi:hypothetical protein HMPREF1317_1093 [Schaalia georgiae F0490]|uniref:Uncharacterized protein n=1 Tax=Schaalia georgiae F0490 TaxID=1125717 RepID=J1H106_9ACTO|nr:hypothetical protein HMPREF1317_1093 [Schaalia georgiae F0490]
MHNSFHGVNRPTYRRPRPRGGYAGSASPARLLGQWAADHTHS